MFNKIAVGGEKVLDNNINNNINNAININKETNNVLGDMYNTMVQVNDMSQSISQNINNTLNNTITSNTNIQNLNINLGEIFSTYSEINQQQINFNENVEDAKKKTEGLFDKIKKVSSSVMGMFDINGSDDLFEKAVNYSDNLVGMQGNISNMNDGSQSNSELQDKIYGASMRSRTDMSSTIETSSELTSIGFNNDEAIQYTENLNKLFAIAGTGQEAQESATNAMVQSLADGVVSGEELNSIFSTTPEIVAEMAVNMDMPVNEMMQLAEQGQLTSDMLKNSMIGATDNINEKFGSVKATWSDTMTNVGNMATVAFEPVGTQISDIINSQSFATVIDGIGQGMAAIAPILAFVLEGVSALGSFIVDNFSIIAPILAFIIGLYIMWAIAINGVKTATTIATKITDTYNAVSKALSAIWAANPIVIIIMAIIAALYLVVAIINKVCGTSYSATGIIAGVIMTAVAVVWNLFLALADFILGIIGALINPFISIANFIGNVFTNPISSIIYLFRDMAVNVLSVIKTIASAMDKVFGTDMAGTVDGWIDGVNNLADKAVEKFAADENYEQKYEQFNLTTESLGLKRMDYGDSFNTGYEFGEGLTDFSMPDISGGLSGSLGGGLDSSFGGTNIGGLGTEDYSGLWDGTGVNESTMNNISTSTTNMGSNTYNTAENTFSTTNNSSELVTISKSILEIMQTNMEKENSKPTAQNITVDLSGMNNKFASAEDGETFVNYLTNELIRKMNSSASGVYI